MAREAIEYKRLSRGYLAFQSGELTGWNWRVFVHTDLRSCSFPYAEP